MDIKASRPVSLSEAREILVRRKDESELGYEQTQAVENVERFAVLDRKKTQKLIDSIKSAKISEELAIKIIDVRPDNPATLKAILVKDRIEITEEEAHNIIKELG
jgi:DNA-directed RNA polymerase subunit F